MRCQRCTRNTLGRITLLSPLAFSSPSLVALAAYEELSGLIRDAYNCPALLLSLSLFFGAASACDAGKEEATDRIEHTEQTGFIRQLTLEQRPTPALSRWSSYRCRWCLTSYMPCRRGTAPRWGHAAQMSCNGWCPVRKT